MRGPLRDIILCHCVECRRWGGHLGAFAATRREHLEIADDGPLRWTASPQSDRRARRGFCGDCGSGLFWQAAGSERIHVAAGTLDRPTGLRIVGHWYVHQAGDYDELPDHGLPPQPGSVVTEIRWS